MADFQTLSLAKNYTDESVGGLTEIKGAPCTIDKVTPITEDDKVVGQRIFFKWENNAGQSKTTQVDVMYGEDGLPGDPGDPGEDGVTPDIQVGTVTTLPAGSKATVTRRPDSPDDAPVFDFGIPRGADGSGGSGGTSDHIQLTNRDADDQHPISAITGLQDALDNTLQSTGGGTVSYSEEFGDGPHEWELNDDPVLASEISFDNTGTGLSATTLQEVVVELLSLINGGA